MAQGSFSEGGTPSNQSSADDKGKRWYVWQVSLNNQPELTRYLAEVYRHWEATPGLTLVPWPWLRLHLATVGASSEVSYADAHALAELLGARLSDMPAGEIAVSGIEPINNRLVLTIDQRGLLDRIATAIRSCASEVSSLKDRAVEIPDDYHVTTAYIDKIPTGKKLLESLDPAGQAIPIHVLKLSHVLLNRTSFSTEIWSTLDRLSLTTTVPE